MFESNLKDKFENISSNGMEYITKNNNNFWNKYHIKW